MLGSDGLPPSAALLLGGTLMCIVGFKASRRGSSWMREEKLEFDAASRPAEAGLSPPLSHATGSVLMLGIAYERDASFAAPRRHARGVGD